jgi:excinuclease ABC subunit C
MAIYPNLRNDLVALRGSVFGCVLCLHRPSSVRALRCISGDRRHESPAPISLAFTVLSVERPDLATIPHSPGVYRYLDGQDAVLYVGKAKDLRSRISSYFSKDLHPRTAAMISEATSFSYVLCTSEAEALLVEHAFIRDLQPPYNVKLRFDEHAYPYIALSRHAIPRILTWHGAQSTPVTVRSHASTPEKAARTRKTVERFGPYPNASHAHALRDVIESVWQLRPCKDAKLDFHQNAKRACLLGELNRCCAPCVDATGYGERVAAARSLLDGNTKKTEQLLEEEMATAATARSYEHAATVRDRLEAVRSLASRAVPTEVPGLVDALATACDQQLIAGQLLRVRNGVLRGCPTYTIERALLISSDDLSDTIDALLATAYADATPASVLLVETMPSSASLAFIRQLAPSAQVRLARNSQERALLELAKENAAHALERAKSQRASDTPTRHLELALLAELLDLPAPPLRIECLDISHFQGSNTVASFAVLEEGLARPKAHRRMRLEDRADDPASIEEAVTRRIQHLAHPTANTDWSLATTPQLLLIDGGQQQLQAAMRALTAAGVSIPVASLSKRLEEVWLPAKAAPLRLPLDSPALFILQRARDEAHRSSLAYQRSLRTLDKPLLDSVKGLGPKRRERLLREAGSIEDLRKWSKSRLLACGWLPTAVAESIWEVLSRTERTLQSATPYSQTAHDDHGDNQDENAIVAS